MHEPPPESEFGAGAGAGRGAETGNVPAKPLGVREGRVAAYARVSTQGQQDSGTISSQISAIEEFLHKNNCQISGEHIYVDDGWPGGSVARPALDRLRDSVGLGKYDAVVVYDPDRLARKYVHQMILLEEFERQGCRVEFIRRPIGRSPDEALLLQMQGAIAEYEKAKIAERTRRGKLHKMRNGELVNAKRAFGYKYIPRQRDTPARYTVLEEEAAAVKNIFSWFLSEGASLRDIAERLNTLKVPTVKGGQWHASSVGCVLRNSMVTGTGYAHKHRVVEPERKYANSSYSKYEKSSSRLRPREEWLPFSCPRIIDDEAFELAGERLRRNKELAARNTAREYLLRGLVFCGACGRRVQISGVRNDYFCAFTQKSMAWQSGAGLCANTARFPVAGLDGIVWKEAARLVRKPSGLKMFHRRHGGKPSPRAAGGAASVAEKIKNTEERIRRLNSLYIDGSIGKQEHSERLRILSDQKHVLQSQLDKISGESLSEAETESILSSFSRFSAAIKDQLKSADFKTKRFIIEQLVHRVVLSKNDVTIELSAPLNKSVLCTQSFNS